MHQSHVFWEKGGRAALQKYISNDQITDTIELKQKKRYETLG